MNVALTNGDRGLKGGLTLDRILAKYRGVRRRYTAPPLSEEKILRWCDAFFAEYGRWPGENSGAACLPDGEDWKRIHNCLMIGLRGLPGGSSVVRLLAEHRGAQNFRALPPLTEEQIVRWARAHKRRTGSWPTRDSGPIPDSSTPGEAWKHVAAALRRGTRGLPGDSTLARLLHKRCGVPLYRPGRRPIEARSKS